MITKEGYKRVAPNWDDLSNKFIELATYVVENECTDMSGNPVIGNAKDILVRDKAYDMELANNFIKNKYLLMGGLIGIGITVTGFTAFKIINRVKNKEEA